MSTAQAGSNLDASITGLRVQIAALTRLLHKEGILTYSGHASVRLPGRDAFLIQSINDSRAGIEPGNFLICDLDCNVLEGPAGDRPPIEVFIHSEILRARPDIEAVVHTHSDLAAMFTMLDGVELALMKSHAHRWSSGIPTHPDPSHIKTAEQGKQLAASLGDHFGALLRAHGGVLVAESLPALLVDAVHFEENATAHYQAATVGKIKPLTRAELDLIATIDNNREQHCYKLWRHYVGMGLDDGTLPRDWNENLWGSVNAKAQP
ncbi:MAG: class II aldolase/adducin family protein [Alphaproteobacteria bacterium]|nr:class II aldolase/adducin family protein [Alphaproteobacteria bacterium]